MEWFGSIATSLIGLPWWAVFTIIAGSIGCTKGVDALLRIRSNRLEERMYEDEHEKARYEAVIEVLEARIEKLEGIVDKQSVKLEAASEALRKCEIEHERSRGELNVMKVKVDALERHDKQNTQNKDNPQQKVVEKAIQILDAKQVVDAGQANP
jgi:chromosome segregation ATPase